jgi:hypothetical protein
VGLLLIHLIQVGHPLRCHSCASPFL